MLKLALSIEEIRLTITVYGCGELFYGVFTVALIFEKQQLDVDEDNTRKCRPMHRFLQNVCYMQIDGCPLTQVHDEQISLKHHSTRKPTALTSDLY